MRKPLSIDRDMARRFLDLLDPRSRRMAGGALMLAA